MHHGPYEYSHPDAPDDFLPQDAPPLGQVPPAHEPTAIPTGD